MYNSTDKYLREIDGEILNRGTIPLDKYNDIMIEASFYDSAGISAIAT